MDLNQCKLSKSEWNSIEVPVSEQEKEVLTLIMQGYNNVNIKYNKYNSLFTFLKIEYNKEMEDHLYNNYFSRKINEIKKKYNSKSLEISVTANPNIKKADLIRISKNDATKMNADNAYEYLLIQTMELILKYNKKESSKWMYYYFTLFKLLRNTIPHVNRHILQIMQNIILELEEKLCISKVIENAVEYIEKNEVLLKYADMVLYEHQKQIFTIMKQRGPKLVLYIAPTGTGKTMSPIGLSESHRIIFVCAARHVGLALARAAISVNKKIAFAFGCASADDIRLHYFAAKEFKVNKRSGGIGKVDNSVGDKVEIMICDIKSYLPAMYYMKAFNPIENIITYWDEPTITLDYESHELHEIIKKNWTENLIGNMILSSATLPKLHEITSTVSDFEEKFYSANIHNIVSNDCKKSIPILNKNGYVVLPHYLSEDYSTILDIVNHCDKNQTLLRYFDLKEVVEFIQFVEKNNYILGNTKIDRNFASLDDINMQNIKIHYLNVLKKLKEGTWGAIYLSLRINRTKRILSNDKIDPKGNKVLLKKMNSVGPETSNLLAGAPIVKLMSEQITKSYVDNSTDDGNCAIYVTTKDAYTLTDGPTIFLAANVEKIAKFCIQQANIPAIVMTDIMEKIEFNNKINEKIKGLENDLEDITEKNSNKDLTKDDNKKKKDVKIKESTDPSLDKLKNELDMLRSMIKSAELNDTFIPNKQLHLKKWAEYMEIQKVFTSDIDENTILDIMALNDVDDSWKVLLLMGIGVFTNKTSIAYTEIMKRLADQQKLYMIIASSDYIYGTNYQFCHGYLSKDLVLTQEKIIQALGRIGRNNIQQNYSIRLRDDEQIKKLFYEELDKPEVRNMNLLFNSK